MKKIAGTICAITLAAMACAPAPREPITGTTGTIDYELNLTDNGNVREVVMRTDPSLQDPSPHVWSGVRANYTSGREHTGWWLAITSPGTYCKTYADSEGWFGNTYGPQGPRGNPRLSQECPQDLAQEVMVTLDNVIGERLAGER